MNSEEEQSFFIRIAVDEELRRTFKAYQVVDSSIDKERQASRMDHVAARANVAAMLESRRRSNPATIPVVPAAAPGGVALTRWLLLGISTLGLGVGTFYIGSTLSSSGDPAGYRRSPGGSAVVDTLAGGTTQREEISRDSSLPRSVPSRVAGTPPPDVQKPATEARTEERVGVDAPVVEVPVGRPADSASLMNRAPEEPIRKLSSSDTVKGNVMLDDGGIPK